MFLPKKIVFIQIIQAQVIIVKINAFCFVWLYMSACPLGYFGMNCSSKCVHPYYGLKCKSKCSCYHGDCHHIHGCNPNPGGELYMIKCIYVLLIDQTVHSKIIFNNFRMKFNPLVTDNLN